MHIQIFGHLHLFIIHDEILIYSTDEDSVFVSSESADSDTESDGDVAVEGCGSPRMQRSRKNRKCRDRHERRDSTAYAANRTIDELMYDDNLPEVSMTVTSNWVPFLHSDVHSQVVVKCWCQGSFVCAIFINCGGCHIQVSPTTQKWS